MKTNFLITFILCASLGMAQSVIKIEKGIVSLDSKQWLQVAETKIDKKTDYEVVKTLLGEIIAQLTFVNNGDKVYFKAEFATVAKKYEINYPAGTTILTVLESFNKNKIIVDSKIDLAGLQNYCDTRKIPLAKILNADEQKAKDDRADKEYQTFKAAEDKKKAKTAEASTNTQAAAGNKYISFSLTNNAKRNVRFFIGKEVKYGSGSYNTIGGNTITSEHGTIGEKFCIVDEHDNAISCTTISEGMGKIEINSSGTGFGN